MNFKAKIKKINKLLFITCLICFPQLILAQQTETDSLLIVIAKFRTIPNYQEDTNYINSLNFLAFKYNQIKPDTTIFLSQ